MTQRRVPDGADAAEGSGNRRSSLRSAAWFDAPGEPGLAHRAYLKSEGISQRALSNRPIIGIANSWSEYVSCNLHFRRLAEAVKRGVLQAGGLPLEFPTISLGEILMKPTTMLYRNLMSMDIEESIRAYPMDAVVLLVGCDKTIPASLMGAASVDLPTIVVTAGPALAGFFCGREVSGGTDVWHYTDEYRAGRMSQAEWEELESSLVPSAGHCSEMGTASTMSTLVEVLGLALPGSAAVLAVDARRFAGAEAAGGRAVEIARAPIRPSELLTRESFENAIAVLAAMGGSTNAIVHLLALAGRVGVPLALSDFDTIFRRTPMITNVRPSGTHLFEDVQRAGGIPAVVKELLPLLHANARTVTGRSLGENVAAAAIHDRDVITSLDQPFRTRPALAVLRGTLAPNGAVIKPGATTGSLDKHVGHAVVFEDIDDLGRRIDDPALDIRPESIMVLKNAGPKGAPGMPEWGHLPIPTRLLQAGVSDMVRISDARMSGTAFGTVVLHVSPESAVGGPLGLVQTGDLIELDVDAGKLELRVDDRELHARAAAFHPPTPKYRRGYGALFLEHVLQSDEGCDFDFLRKLPDEAAVTEPLGLVGDAINV
jgi:dihydroxy-acid dehydratase